MLPIPKTLVSFGAVALAATGLIFFSPKAAHAIAATLVQVTNTAASPAVTQDVSKMASQNILLVSSAGALFPKGSIALQQMLPNGTIGGSPFVVPAGYNLVVTTIALNPSGTNGVDAVSIANTVSGVLREEFFVTDTTSTQLQFPNGFVFPAGESVSVNNYGLSSGAVTFTLHGYLTAN